MKPLFLLLCTIPAALVGGPIFEITDLGTLGGSSTAGYSISNGGWVVGAGTDRGGATTAMAGDNSLRPFAPNAQALDVNNTGAIAGVQFRNGESYAVMWDQNGAHFLGTAGSAAMGINDQGQVTGMSSNGRAFLTDVGGQGVRDLGVMIGGDWATGRGVNSSGDVTGYGTVAGGDFRAFRWNSGSGYTQLDTLGGKNAYGMSISNDGTVAGHSETGNGTTHATIWTSNRTLDLGTLGGKNSYAYGINNRGAVVGYAQVANGEYHAFLYENGMVYDLNDLLANGFGWKLLYAYGINDEWQIVGEGLYQGEVHAFRLDLRRILSSVNGRSGSLNGLLEEGGDGGSDDNGDGTPDSGNPFGINSLNSPLEPAAVPEPSSWALGLAGLALLAARRTRTRSN